MKFIAIMITVAIAGCTRHTSSRVWADDDRGELEWLDYRGPGGSVMSGARPEGTEGIVHDASGDRVVFHRDRRIEHYPTRNTLFFMRSRGYVLALVHDKWPMALVLDADSGRELWRHGTQSHVDDLFLPSPDGLLVAAFRTLASSDRGRTIGVEFLDASDGELLRGASVFQRSVTDHAGTFDGYVDLTWATWTPDGELIVETEAGSEAVTVSLDGEVTATQMPGCWYPSTTSSIWSSTGEALTDNEIPKDDLIRQPFGCQ